MLSARATGLITIALGGILPVVTYVGARVALANDAAKGGPPNQGAMVIAYLGTLASIGLGIVLIVIGAAVLLWSSRNQRKQLAETPPS